MPLSGRVHSRWLPVLLLAASSLAFAHGEGGHAAKPGAAVKEQKPWGIAGDAAKVTRTIEVVMTDAMRFTPDRIEVREGETIRFVHRNPGRVMHEFVLGTKQELDEHAELMKRFPNMEHDEPYMAHVAPGQTGEVVWHFNRAGEFEFACLIPGHYEAGMLGRVTVAGRPSRGGKPAAGARSPAAGG
jgi:uncharacterized cupredoxin-like copper-binding protein